MLWTAFLSFVEGLLADEVIRSGGPSADPSVSDQCLHALLEGPFRRLRDANHVDPNAILVWDGSRDPVIEAVGLLELLARYPCGEVGSQWAPEDYTRILKAKHDLYRMSVVAHALAAADARITPVCGTVLLVISPRTDRPHRWLRITTLIAPRP